LRDLWQKSDENRSSALDLFVKDIMGIGKRKWYQGLLKKSGKIEAHYVVVVKITR
jgi:hypothetical protein